jgi:flagellar hook-associated protein 3 FlgL
VKLANIGDMAQAMTLRRDTVAVKNDLNRLTQELNSGQKADLQSAFSGRFAPLAGLDRSLQLNAGYLTSNAAATRIADGQQTALASLQDTLMAAGPEFLKVASGGEATQLAVTTANAGRQFEQIVGALNSRIGQQSLFAGEATDGPALAPARDILAALDAALVGAVGPGAVDAAARAWFDTPGGGFETVAYVGSARARAGLDIAEGERETLAISALEPGLRDALRGLAVTALMDRGLLAGDTPGQKELMSRMGETLVGATDKVTALRAGLGFSQERIDTARARSEAEATGLRQARAALVEADPYETAMLLQQVQAQLETIYTVTARVSGLSLAAFLR